MRERNNNSKESAINSAYHNYIIFKDQEVGMRYLVPVLVALTLGIYQLGEITSNQNVERLAKAGTLGGAVASTWGGLYAYDVRKKAQLQKLRLAKLTGKDKNEVIRLPLEDLLDHNEKG